VQRMDSATAPLVSIGIPTYNGSKRIAGALASIWKQGYPNLEIIISDNCSSDNSIEVIAEIRKDHPEIKYYRQTKNVGMLPNFEFLLRNASGKYFMWLSDDDKIEPGTIPKYVEFLEANVSYSLVSGAIKYWKEETLDLIESGFTFEQKSPGLRLIDFYSRVVFCGIMHGLMRRELTKDIPLHSIIGNDYHFVGNLAYLGKIKNFDFVGYHKHLGGTSRSFMQYAKSMGDSDFAGRFPHLKIAGDTFAEVTNRSAVYSKLPAFSRTVLGLSSCIGTLFCYYGRILISERIKNYILTPIRSFMRTRKSEPIIL
jgi:glycosyltransferase involved in cell wall biosynthesis